MDEILKIIIERNKKGKVLSKSDIKRICQIIIGIHNFIESPKILFGSRDSLDPECSAIVLNGNIHFYMDTLIKKMEEGYSSMPVKDELDGGKIPFYNYCILNTIFHEFEHIRQWDKIYKGHSDIDTKLFIISQLLKEIERFYDDNYEDFITEVDAIIRSEISSYLIYRRIPNEIFTENDKRIYASGTTKELIFGYDISSRHQDVISPSERLLVSAKDTNEFDITEFSKLISSGKDLTLYKKVILGLPLTYMEAAYINMISTNVRQGEKVNFIRKLQKRL